MESPKRIWVYIDKNASQQQNDLIVKGSHEFLSEENMIPASVNDIKLLNELQKKKLFYGILKDGELSPLGSYGEVLVLKEGEFVWAVENGDYSLLGGGEGDIDSPPEHE